MSKKINKTELQRETSEQFKLIFLPLLYVRLCDDVPVVMG